MRSPWGLDVARPRAVPENFNRRLVKSRETRAKQPDVQDWAIRSAARSAHRRDRHLLFTPAAPLRTVQYVPGHNRWHPDIPAVAEVIAGGSVRLNCQGGDVLCGPIGIVGAEPGDLVMIEGLGLDQNDRRNTGAGHPGSLGCAPSHAMLRSAG